MRLTSTTQVTSRILQPGALHQALAVLVAKAAHDVDAEVKVQMGAAKHGRVYRRGPITRRASKFTRALGLRERTTKAGNQRAITGYKFHRASAPGEAPAIDFGLLVNSSRVKAKGTRASVTWSMRYAEVMERKRPYAGPALAKTEPKFVSDVDETLGRLCR